MDESFSRRSEHRFLKLILCGLPLLWPQLSVPAAQSAMLAWLPSASTNVVGYNIYCGTKSHDYDHKVLFGNTNSATVTGLADGVTYFFCATAVDSLGDESPFSNEAVYTVPAAAATLAASQNPAGQFNVSVSGISGCQYVVQTSTNLMDWVSVQTNTAPFTFTDPNAGQWTSCFYRAFYLSP